MAACSDDAFCHIIYKPIWRKFLCLHHWKPRQYVHVSMLKCVRVATNLEFSGISLNMENSGNSVQPHGKIVTNKVFLVRHSNICVKQLVTCYIAGVEVEWPLMKVIITFTFCCDNLRKAWKTQEIFFSYFVATLCIHMWCCLRNICGNLCIDGFAPNFLSVVHLET